MNRKVMAIIVAISLCFTGVMTRDVSAANTVSDTTGTPSYTALSIKVCDENGEPVTGATVAYVVADVCVTFDTMSEEEDTTTRNMSNNAYDIYVHKAGYQVAFATTELKGTDENIVIVLKEEVGPSAAEIKINVNTVKDHPETNLKGGAGSYIYVVDPTISTMLAMLQVNQVGNVISIAGLEMNSNNTLTLPNGLYVFATGKTKYTQYDKIVVVKGENQEVSVLLTPKAPESFSNTTQVEGATLVETGASGDYDWEQWSNGTVRIVGYHGESMQVQIPSKVMNDNGEEIVVNTIGNSAFALAEIKSIDMSGVMSIEEGAFYGCSNLTSVTMPNMINIGQSAFAYCSELSSVTMPKVTRIEKSAFYKCIKLSSVTMPLLTSIESHTFDGCRSLNSVVMPQVTSIGTSAFNGCVSLEDIDLLQVTSIDSSVFYGCPKVAIYCYPDSVAESFAKNNWNKYGIPLREYKVTLSSYSYSYDNTAKEPTVTLMKDGKELLHGVDYTVSYKNNIVAGAATVTIKGTGNGFCGTVEQTFSIIKKLENGDMTLAESSITYDGKVKKPAVVVKDGTKTLKKDVDYTVTYPSSSTNVGTYTVTVTGKGYYTGTLTKNFSVIKKVLVSGDMTLAESSITYDGKAKKPAVVVKSGTNTLKKDVDYTVSYPSSSTNVGTYTVTVTGKGNYSGIITAKYSITKKKLVSGDMTLAKSSITYDGKDKKPAVVVKNGTTTLKRDVDYTLTYPSKAINAGTYTVTVTGKGNYSGTITAKYSITRATTTITAKDMTKKYGDKVFALGAKVSTGGSTLTYKSSNTKVCTIDKNGKITITGTGISTITIQAAQNTNYKAITKTIKITVVPKKASLSKVSSSKTKQITATWYKDKQATGYEVQLATKIDFKSIKKTIIVGNNETVSKNFISLNSGTTYYVRVRAYKMINGKKQYGDYSTIKSVKCK